MEADGGLLKRLGPYAACFGDFSRRAVTLSLNMVPDSQGGLGFRAYGLKGSRKALNT